MEITFVRHGQSEANAAGRWQGQSDSPLSPLGEEQARMLAKRLSARPFDVIVASDLARADSTAAALGRPFATDPAWREVNIGDWELLTREIVEEQYPDEFAAVLAGQATKLGGGESWAEFDERVIETFDRLRQRLDRGDRALVATHGGVVASVVKHVLGIEGRDTRLGRFENTSITTIRYGDATAEVAAYNDSAHLGPLGGWARERLAEGHTVVSLIRHGETDANVADRWQGAADGDLSAEGRKQIQALARWYGGLDSVYSSPLQRARDTASALAERGGLALDEHHGLVEMNMGEWEDRTTPEIQEGWADLWREIYEEHRDLPRGYSGESMQTTAARVNAALTELAHRHAGARVGVVSHAGAIRAYVLGLLDFEHHKRDRLAFPANTSVTHVVVGEDGAYLADYNIAPHLG